jgi:diaminopimelate decarboxylase
MDFFNYRGGRLFAEDANVADIAREVGTPLYIYSRQTVELHLRRLAEAFKSLSPLICYSVKANGNLALLKVCVEAGAGFDIVSGGELYRALAAGADASKIVYAGVGKTDAEISQALDARILLFNVESPSELAAINRIAAAGDVRARVALRVNPDVDAHTHEYTTTGRKQNKFGITMDVAEGLAKSWADYPRLDLVGIDMHIGSQITEVEPYAAAIDRLFEFLERLRGLGHRIAYFDCGGGFGIFYRGGEARTADEFASVITPRLTGKGLKVILEPGRFVVGNAGILVSRVVYVKKQGGKRFIIVDAGMNDLVRPSFYGSYHKKWPTQSHLPFTVDESEAVLPADVVGPICESGDFLAKDRPLPHMDEGELLAVFGAGAYGMSMASNYNARPRAAEVMVNGDQWRIVRRRETYEDLVRPEVEGIE